LPAGRVRLDLPRKGRCIEMTAEQFIAKLVALQSSQGAVRSLGEAEA
jgi:hypothetical protein